MYNKYNTRTRMRQDYLKKSWQKNILLQIFVQPKYRRPSCGKCCCVSSCSYNIPTNTDNLAEVVGGGTYRINQSTDILVMANVVVFRPVPTIFQLTRITWMYPQNQPKYRCPSCGKCFCVSSCSYNIPTNTDNLEVPTESTKVQTS